MSQVCDTITITPNVLLGDTAMAPRSYTCGEEVLREAPVLVMPVEMGKEDMELLTILSRVSGADSDVWKPLVSSRHLDAKTLQWLMGHLHSPLRPKLHRGQKSDPCAVYIQDGEQRAVLVALSTPELFDKFFSSVPSSSIWEELRLGVSYPATRDVSVFKVVSFIHACRINIHTSSTTGSAAIFPTACKFAHSCSPNTIWALRVDGGGGAMVGVHVATRAISKGEPLSFSYLGSGMNMLSDNAARGEMLSTLHFDCGCDRCGQVPDATRMLLCKACGKRALSFTGGWECGMCQYVPPPPAIGQILHDESMMEAFVMWVCFGKGMEKAVVSYLEDEGCMLKRLASFANETSYPVAHIKDRWHPLVARWAVVGLVEDVLGVDHYLYMLSCTSLVQALYKAIVAHHPIPPIIVGMFKQLLHHIRQGDIWLSSSCNLSPHHSLYWYWVQHVCGAAAGWSLPTDAVEALTSFTEKHLTKGNIPLDNAILLASWPEFLR